MVVMTKWSKWRYGRYCNERLKLVRLLVWNWSYAVLFGHKYKVLVTSCWKWQNKAQREAGRYYHGRLNWFGYWPGIGHLANGSVRAMADDCVDI